MELSGKVVVVTGASMGIGEAIAKVFADQGASVVMLSRDAGAGGTRRANFGDGMQRQASGRYRSSDRVDPAPFPENRRLGEQRGAWPFRLGGAGGDVGLSGNIRYEFLSTGDGDAGDDSG